MINNPANIGFGCVSLTRQPSLRKALDLLAVAFDGGITHFDTAPVYGSGYSEKILGRFIHGRREKVTITTKCGLGSAASSAIPPGLALPLNALKRRWKAPPSPPAGIELPIALSFRTIDEDYVRAALTASLGNLQTSYIDFYLLHEALPAFLTPGALSFLREQQKNGVIRQLGIAAAYVNLPELKKEDVAGWDVLQYENGIHYPSGPILKQFNDKTHFYHSALKFLRTLPEQKYTATDWAGILLNLGVKSNPAGKVLFATTRVNTVRDNLKAYARYGDLTFLELNNILHAVC